MSREQTDNNVLVNILGHPSNSATFNIESNAQPLKQAQKSIDAMISRTIFLVNPKPVTPF